MQKFLLNVGIIIHQAFNGSSPTGALVGAVKGAAQNTVNTDDPSYGGAIGGSSGSFITSPSLLKDPFHYIGNNDLSGVNGDFRSTAASLYQLFLVVGIVGLLYSIIKCGIKFMFLGPEKRAEAKLELLSRMMQGVVLFAFPFFAGLILTILSSP